jgi:hypothetical protein
MIKLKDRAFVVRKGCFDRLNDPTKVCINLGEVLNIAKNKRMFYCMHSFPENCGEYGCPKMMSIDIKWQEELRKKEMYF